MRHDIYFDGTFLQSVDADHIEIKETGQIVMVKNYGIVAVIPATHLIIERKGEPKQNPETLNSIRQ